MMHLERMATALALAAPWALAPRFGDLAHCVEASIGGVGALRRRKIDAKTTTCAVVAGDGAPNLCAMYVGHTRKSAHAWYAAHCVDPMTFDEWTDHSEGHGSALPETSLHVIIEARHCGRRALIDLTVGQVVAASGGRIAVPASLVYIGRGWPVLGTSESAFIEYAAAPDSGTWRDYRAPGLVDDLDAIMSVALSCDINRERFAAEMLRTAALVDGDIEQDELLRRIVLHVGSGLSVSFEEAA